MIAPDKELSQIVRKQCFAKMSTAETTIVFVISMLWIMYFFYCFFELKEYRDTYYFYRYLLQIDEDDLQSLNWEQVTDRIMQLRISNAATANAMRSQRFSSLPIEKMNAHDIANRIMRKENYIIALINNEVLNFKLQIIGNRRHLTKLLEFIISIAIFDHFFDASGYIKPEHISSKNRKKSIENLKTRILLSGLFLLVCSPFVIGSFALYYFLRYSSEYHQNPGALGSRRYTSYAFWLFREYNELPHYFEQRLRRSYYPAIKYQSQFRNEPLNQLYRLASFIVGSFLVVLVIGSIIDSEVFTKFEITKNRPASFYILLFGAIYTYCRASIKDNQDATEPGNLMQEIANFTHYFPDAWKSKLISNSVRNEFLMLYDLNVSIVFWEIASVVLAPFILWMNFMPNASKIVDFFRQHTTHVEGIGYACSFACFETKKQSNPSTESLQNHNKKMESSYISFQNANPNWHPRNLRMELTKYAGNQNSFDQSFF